MMCLIFFPQSAQDGDRISPVRLIDHDNLKTALQSLVSLEILLILIKRGGSYGPKFTPGECRLQYIGGIHCSLSFAGSYQGMYLVNKQYNLAV